MPIGKIIVVTITVLVFLVAIMVCRDFATPRPPFLTVPHCLLLLLLLINIIGLRLLDRHLHPHLHQHIYINIHMHIHMYTVTCTDTELYRWVCYRKFFNWASRWASSANAVWSVPVGRHLQLDRDTTTLRRRAGRLFGAASTRATSARVRVRAATATER